MKKYVLEDKIITATEKAYNVLYREQGYLPLESETISEVNKKVKIIKKNKKKDK